MLQEPWLVWIPFFIPVSDRSALACVPSVLHLTGPSPELNVHHILVHSLPSLPYLLPFVVCVDVNKAVTVDEHRAASSVNSSWEISVCVAPI